MTIVVKNNVIKCANVIMMRIKYCIIMILLAIMPLASHISIAQAKTALTSYIYARVDSDNVSLYKTPSVAESDNVLFDLPKSYFVLLISNFSSDFYKAQYRDVVGFVLKDSVVAVRETPSSPYLKNVTFRVFSSDGKKLMSSPSHLSSALCDVDISKDMDYYGACFGTEMINGRGNVWYYTKYNDTFGYLYAGLCDRLEGIIPNSEVTTARDDVFSSGDNDYLYSLISMSTPMKILLLSLVSLPAVVIVIMIFRPIKVKKKQGKISKFKAKRDIIKEIQIQ